MKSVGRFPFGQLVQEVAQTDRTPKKVFVLGVYASAVHACWVNPEGKTVVKALAVASEPYIFWRGENAESVIQKIVIPHELGKLKAARKELNGPSGIALDHLILNPLGLDREEVWLCDLVSHSCVNPDQIKAIKREYLPIISKYGLPEPSVPPLPNPIINETRRNEIVNEINESGARFLILLGDLPILWFLSHFDSQWTKLSNFGRDDQSYGQLHKTQLDDKEIIILPLAHPRQIAKLGRFSATWYNAHKIWVERSASKVSKLIKTED
jgi:hypothetical protein